MTSDESIQDNKPDAEQNALAAKKWPGPKKLNQQKQSKKGFIADSPKPPMPPRGTRRSMGKR